MVLFVTLGDELDSATVVLDRKDRKEVGEECDRESKMFANGSFNGDVEGREEVRGIVGPERDGVGRRRRDGEG